MKYEHPRGVIHRARAEDIYPSIEPGSVRLVISDGPYGIGKAAWDMQTSPDALRAWYARHIEAWGRVCQGSATVYLWNTAEGWAALHPLMLAAGWTFRALVVWDKGPGGSVAVKSSPERLFTWPDVTEVCGMYQREAWSQPRGPAVAMQYAAGADERNWIRLWLASEWDATGLSRKEADRALGRNGMAGHYFNASQWSLPTWEAYQQLAAHAAEHGAPRERPYFIHPAASGLAASYEHLRAEYEHLRAEYEQARCPFDWPKGVTNVWSRPQVTGSERLLGADGAALHPCQKPTEFARRMVLASSRPGDLVLEPFGGTCRVAVAIESLLGHEARRYICAEPDEDGRDYIAAVNRQLRESLRQVSLFGATP